MGDFSFSIFPNENFLDLRIYQYGYEQCSPLHSFGPFIRNHYLFHYVISGRGSLDATAEDGVTTRRYELRAGQGFLICPGLINTYFADENDPWKYVWLEFDGLRASESLRYAGLTAAQPIYRADDETKSAQVRDLMLYIAEHSEASALHLIGYLYLFVDALMQSSSTRVSAQENQLKDFYIQEAVNYIEQNYQRNLTVEEVADACRLNRSYFSKLFKENVGCPPQKFVIRVRLAKAAELMCSSNAAISEIAVRCGYSNQFHFSRAFKKHYGIPPQKWRAQNRKHHA
ncbi:AraC family transcriptional regulator [Intestinimonas massiliensis (ex Afouda et al. 2020)]|uniref:AraC family transcriptional regulator n=1 Tax=Intestinimonas massiliensis (ex Afouda et al. 2020) TaxID=1673721 RepID=UPI00103146EC|nr:AraC family transcriptional regulator [Intestinimonas massiliensis (ex Afouda et al. 2020)]